MTPPKTPPLSVKFDEERDLYELGAEIEGTFVPFATLPGSDVRASIELKTGTAQTS